MLPTLIGKSICVLTVMLLESTAIREPQNLLQEPLQACTGISLTFNVTVWLGCLKPRNKVAMLCRMQQTGVQQQQQSWDILGLPGGTHNMFECKYGEDD